MKKQVTKTKPKLKKKADAVVVPASVLMRLRAQLQASKANQGKKINPYILASHPETVFPKGLPKSVLLAQDQEINGALQWASSQIINGAWSEGLMFMGYTYLSELTQRPEYRHISETIATEMTREWIEIQSKNTGEDKKDKINDLIDEMTRLNVKDCFRRICEKDGFFGRSHLFLDFGDNINSPELKMPIGTGDPTDELSIAKVKKGSLRSLKVIEPIWCYPTNYNATSPLRDDWYNPQIWFCQGTEVHATRLLPFVGREVADLLKPAYSFGGLSLSQMAKPYVDNWLRTRQSVSDIIHSFVVYVLMTNLGTTLQSDDLLNRLDLFNLTRDNKGVMAVDKESEEFKNVTTPLTNLGELQEQSLEQISAITKIPLVKLTGIAPSGLNASSEGEMRCFYDWIKAFQETFFRPHLTTVINFIQLSMFGEVDPDIIFEFKDLWSLNEKEQAEVRKLNSETDTNYVAGGILNPEEIRAGLAVDPTSPYHGIAVDDVPEMPGLDDNDTNDGDDGEEDKDPSSSET